MSGIHNIKRTALLISSAMFASFFVLMSAQTAQAQSIEDVRRALFPPTGGGRAFSIDTTGRMGGSWNRILEITTLRSDGYLEGKYHATGTPAPAAANVTGSITITRGIRITFTAREPMPSGVVNETVFEGAIRLGPRGDSFQGSMAGTFTNTLLGGASDGAGPFPFCAILSSVKPG